MKLIIQAFGKLFLGILLLGLLIFVPAGKFYTNGLFLMGVLFVPMLIAGVVMIIENPELLKKRLKAKETQKEQKMVIFFSAVMFIAGFIVAGLNVRFDWNTLPNGVVIGAVAVFLVGYILYGEVLRENQYLSRTVEVQEGQKVIDRGLYAIVRHPMYSATLLIFLSMPLILGSLYGFLVFLFYPFIIVKRIKSEEAFLEKELEGYCEYIKKVKFRLIPFIW